MISTAAVILSLLGPVQKQTIDLPQYSLTETLAPHPFTFTLTGKPTILRFVFEHKKFAIYGDLTHLRWIGPPPTNGNGNGHYNGGNNSRNGADQTPEPDPKEPLKFITFVLIMLGGVAFWVWLLIKIFF
jgi:hypothetical protein